jgi:F-type H+-transporting ATPase subunit b
MGELIKAVAPWINFAILVVLLVKFLAKPFKDYLKSRHDTVKEKISEAERLLKEAQDIKEAYEAKFSKVEADIEAFRRTVMEELEKDKKRILDDAHALAGRIREQAKLAYDQELKDALAKVQAELVERTLGVAEQKVRDAFKKEDHDHMVEEFIQKVRSIN